MARARSAFLVSLALTLISVATYAQNYVSAFRRADLKAVSGWWLVVGV
jgi:hypothetical protein